MPVELHPDARAVVKAALMERLPLVRIQKGKYLDGLSAFVAAHSAGEKLPKNGKLHEKLVGMIDETPFPTFVTDMLRIRVRDERDFATEPEFENLIDTNEFGSSEQLAEWLLDEFESLPWRYSISIELPTRAVPLELVGDTAQLAGNDFQITRADLFTADQFPLTHPNPKRNDALKEGGLLGLIGKPQEWKQDRSFFIQQRSGFVGIYGGGSVMEECAFALQCLVGLGLAMRLFAYQKKFDNEQFRPEWRVHQLVGEKWEYLAKSRLDDESSEVLRHITTFNFSDDYPEDRRIPWMRSVIAKISKVFSSEKSGAITLAAKWFFDSHKGDDQMLRYIRLMTTLEILLGEHADRSKASLGEILGNRLAYLIGKNHDERHEILSKFKKVYGVRSSILHHGKHKLTAQEYGLISTLEGYCKRAIEDEVSSLLAK